MLVRLRAWLLQASVTVVVLAVGVTFVIAEGYVRFRKPSDNASLVRNDSELTNLDLKEKLLSPDP